MSLATASRSEFTKQFTTANWWVLAIALFAYVGLVTAAVAWALSMAATGTVDANTPAPSADAIAPIVYSLATSVGYVFPLLIGTLIVTTEFRHKTLTPTFLATPRRGQALAAKVVVGAVLGVLYGVIGIVAAVGPGAGIISGYGLDPQFTSGDTWAVVGRMLIAYVLWVLVGVGVGTLLRNQVAAIVVVLVFTQLIEPVGQVASTFVSGLGDVLRFLPGAAGNALVGANILGGTGQTSTSTPLEWWAGGLVLLGYAVVFLIIGHLASWRRDVT